MTHQWTRREFLKGAGGLYLGLFVVGSGSGKMVLARLAGRAGLAGDLRPADPEALPADVVDLGIYVGIDTDGTVRVMIPRPDMGQGVRTSLAMHLAEELDADWQQVRIEQAPADSRYGSQTSAGSSSTRSFWTPMRRAGATAKLMLVRAAARRWGVEEGSCRAEKGYVIHEPTGRRLGYGELAAEAARLPVPAESEVRLKSPADFTIVGRPTRRLDSQPMVNGSAVYGLDARVPDMLFAVIARPPSFGARLTAYDDSAAHQVPGVRDVLRFGSGVAVVAEHTWAALAGRRALQLEWHPGPNAELDDAEIRRRLRERAAGALPELPSEVVTPVQASYDLPYLAHAPMEPMNCLAHVQGDRCQVWVPTQTADGVQRSVANTLRIPRDNVTVKVMYTGGGFGRRLSADYATEAARLSRELGAAVQVLWSRDDDMRHDYYRPASHHALRGGLDERGEIVAWIHRAVLARTGALEAGLELEAIEQELGPDQERPVYSLPRVDVRTLRASLPIPTGAWRSVNNTQWTFANESFMDELAAAGGHDPFELRRRLIGNSRLRRCLELAADKAGWGTPPPAGVGRGIACFAGYGTYVAQVVEASVSAAGQVKVHRVVCAVDCGIAVNPLTIAAQMEGAVADALATALKAEITISGGGVEQANFSDYRWLRVDEMPVVEVHIVDSTASPGGIGEPGFPAVSPALANAIFALTGRRVRRLPIRPEDLAGWKAEPTPTPTSTATPVPPATPAPTGHPEGGTLFLPLVQG